MIEKKREDQDTRARREGSEEKKKGQEGFEENEYTIVDEETGIIEKSSIVLNLYVKEDQEFGAEIDQWPFLYHACKIEKRGTYV